LLLTAKRANCQLSSAGITWREQVILQGDDDDVRLVLSQNTKFVF